MGDVAWRTENVGSLLRPPELHAAMAAGVTDLRALQDRAARLYLRATGLEAATLIELTAFGTAVMLHWRYTRVFRGTHHEANR